MQYSDGCGLALYLSGDGPIKRIRSGITSWNHRAAAAEPWMGSQVARCSAHQLTFPEGFDCVDSPSAISPQNIGTLLIKVTELPLVFCVGFLFRFVFFRPCSVSFVLPKLHEERWCIE